MKTMTTKAGKIARLEEQIAVAKQEADALRAELEATRSSCAHLERRADELALKASHEKERADGAKAQAEAATGAYMQLIPVYEHAQALTRLGWNGGDRAAHHKEKLADAVRKAGSQSTSKQRFEAKLAGAYSRGLVDAYAAAASAVLDLDSKPKKRKGLSRLIPKSPTRSLDRFDGGMEVTNSLLKYVYKRMEELKERQKQ